ncbi:MAG: DUF3160 domain-containing protein [Candidatus Cloacimonetes bacterium]|nr:DUF3160 domain-containing protein [Candidatus Cloacimonadota bacterium]
MIKIKYSIYAILILATIGISCFMPQGFAQEPSTLKIKPIDVSGVKTQKLSFTKYYSISPLDIKLQVPQYNLPLQTNQISNFKEFSNEIPLSKCAFKMLKDNGFAVIRNPFNPREEDITQPYENLKDRDIPIFITAGSLLHLYHIQFDETLRQIEEREFYDKIWEISKELIDDSIEKYHSATGDLKEALKRSAAYFAVGMELLKPKAEQIQEEYSKNKVKLFRFKTDAFFTQEEKEKYLFSVPDFVKKDVEKELELIEKHQGFANSPIFIYKEDYSQYVPRGHYTRSEKLKNYFKAFMWYGRISMLLKGTNQVKAGESCNDFPPCKALISLYDARIQTIQACLIASKFAEDKELRDNWDRIYSVTAFYVGLADDLGPYEYIDALNLIFNGKFAPNDLTDKNIGRLKAKLAEYMPPEIFGGTGDVALWPPFTPEQADEVLGITKGFRLMGQRFIPDSYMFSNLVSPYVGMYSGKNCEQTFTCERTMGGPARCFPRGLDVMALLGSKRAKELLKELGDTEYEGRDKKGNKITYWTQFNKLKEEFDKFSEAEWQKNLYWSWLYALKPLLKEFGDGYPTFMQTKAWQDKTLTTALASWAELRHDTILYAKQSYTMRVMSSPHIPPEKPVVGYIEPVPEFYNRLLALTRMTNKGLDDMNILDRSAKYRLENLENILERLVELSEKELKNEELTQDDYDFIKNFGSRLNGVIAEVDEKAKKTTIVADVHTDGNTGQVLEEGIGYVNLIIVAYKVPDGRILIGAGPVMTYYEFKQPMQDRLTDEKWREMLSSNPPERPEWISNFAE